MAEFVATPGVMVEMTVTVIEIKSGGRQIPSFNSKNDMIKSADKNGSDRDYATDNYQYDNHSVRISLPLLVASLHSYYLSPFSPIGLGFELLQDGYSNISNIDISATVINQMNRMQRDHIEWGREIRGDRRGRDREREGGDDNANELDCK
jgi:hypothetical protein